MILDLLGINEQPWMRDGLCSDTYAPDEWFPTDAQETPELAAELCGGCPSRTDCFDYAMATGELGIWGGTTTTQRENIRTTDACGTTKGYARHRFAGQSACTECKAAQAKDRREKYAAKRANGDAA